MNNNQGRKRVRRAQKKSQISRILLMIGMMALVAVVSIGVTIAWLTDTTETVTNTFTMTDIDITLVESPYSKEDGVDTYGDPTEGVTNSYPLIPGEAYKKDPKVTVFGSEDNVDIYLFVEVEGMDTFPEDNNKYLAYDFLLNNDDSDWELVEGETNVWYIAVPASTTDASWNLLANDKITVPTTLTKEDMQKADGTMIADATLTFKAYAIQQTNGDGTVFTPAQAWGTVNPTTGA